MPVAPTTGSLAARTYVWTTAVAFAVLMGLTIYTWWPAYDSGAQAVISLACGPLLYGGWMFGCLWAVHRLTRMLAGRRMPRAIVAGHAVALLLAVSFTAPFIAIMWQQARADPNSAKGVDYSNLGDGPFFVLWALFTILMYETILVGCLLFVEAVSWLRQYRSGRSAPAPGVHAPAAWPAPSANPPSATVVARAQRDSMGTSIGVVTGVAGLGLGFNGNYVTAGVSVGVGLVALVVVYLVGGRLRG